MWHIKTSTRMTERSRTWYLNQAGSFSGERIDLPNPYFGKNNAAFSIALTKVGSETLIALNSSEFKGHQAGFGKFAFQLFALRDGQFVEVTKEKVVGQLQNDEANQSLIRFFDVDGDGDQDIYLSRYRSQC